MTGGAAAAEHSRRWELGPVFLSPPKPFLRDSGKTHDQLVFGEAYGTSKKAGFFPCFSCPGIELVLICEELIAR